MIIGNVIAIGEDQLFGTGSADDFTNSLGQQGVGFFGDSFAQGNSSAPGVDATGVGWYWNHTNSTTVAITTTDVLGAVNGSMIPQYCVSKFAANGKKTIAALCGFSGSKFYDATGSSSWDTGGTLYATAKSRLDAMLLANNISKPVAIVVTSMGINDISGASVIADVVTAIDSFFSRITTDYPDTKILVSVPGRTNSAENMNNRFALVREAIYRAQRTYTNVIIGGYFPQYVGRGYYQGDNLHLNFDGNAQAAIAFVNAELNTTYAKHTQSVLNMTTASINNTKKTAIDTFITSQATNLAQCDSLQVWVSEAQQDALTDWVFRTCTKLNSATWGSKTGLQSDGVATYIRPEFIPSLQAIYGTQNDIFAKIYVLTNSTPVATQGNALGGVNSTQQISLFQNTSSSVNYRIHDTGGQTIGDTRILDNTLYTIARTNSTTKRILKNGVQVISVTQTSTALLARELYVGALNSTGTAASFLNSSFAMFVIGKESGFNHASFDAAAATLITALAV